MKHYSIYWKLFPAIHKCLLIDEVFLLQFHSHAAFVIYWFNVLIDSLKKNHVWQVLNWQFRK